MAITVEEKYKGRTGNDKKRSVTYLVRGFLDAETADDSLAISHTSAYLVDNNLTVWDGLQLKSISATQLADNVYATVAEYGEFKKSDPPESGEVAFEFSYSASSEHIKQSILTRAKKALTGYPLLDFKGGINVVADGGLLRVEGVDVPVPATTHSWTYYPVNATVSTAYQSTVMGLMGKVNSAAFEGAAAGEVRFVGCRGSVRTGDDWQIRFDFAYKENQTSLSRGGITIPALKGHEILWMLYQEVLDSNDWLVKIPAVAYVEQVIPTGDLTALWT